MITTLRSKATFRRGAMRQQFDLILPFSQLPEIVSEIIGPEHKMGSERAPRAFGVPKRLAPGIV